MAAFPMKILLFSDTHHNFGRDSAWPHPLPEHDVLVLAGDISEYADDDAGNQACDLRRVLADFRARTAAPILYLPGNHEFYRQEYHAALERIERDAAALDIELLHCRSAEIGGVAFHGCTLWSDFSLADPTGYAQLRVLARTSLNDFRCIRYGDRLYGVEDCARLHRRERAWLDRALGASRAARNVAVTHFAPAAGCIAERFRGNVLNPYFVANCDDLVGRHAPDLWLYGHTHHPADFRLGATRLVNNARGYPGRERAAFQPQKVIELPPPARAAA